MQTRLEPNYQTQQTSQTFPDTLAQNMCEIICTLQSWNSKVRHLTRRQRVRSLNRELIVSAFGKSSSRFPQTVIIVLD